MLKVYSQECVLSEQKGADQNAYLRSLIGALVLAAKTAEKSSQCLARPKWCYTWFRPLSDISMTENCWKAQTNDFVVKLYKSDYCTVKPVLGCHSEEDGTVGSRGWWPLGAGRKNCRMHSASLSTCIGLSPVFGTFVLSPRAWLLETGSTSFLICTYRKSRCVK